MKILKAVESEKEIVFDVHVDEEKILPDTKQPDPRYIFTYRASKEVGDPMEMILENVKREAGIYKAHLDKLDAPDQKEEKVVEGFSGVSLDEAIKSTTGKPIPDTGKTLEKPKGDDSQPTDLVPQAQENNSIPKTGTKSSQQTTDESEQTPDVTRKTDDPVPAKPTKKTVKKTTKETK